MLEHQTPTTKTIHQKTIQEDAADDTNATGKSCEMLAVTNANSSHTEGSLPLGGYTICAIRQQVTEFANECWVGEKGRNKHGVVAFHDNGLRTIYQHSMYAFRDESHQRYGRRPEQAFSIDLEGSFETHCMLFCRRLLKICHLVRDPLRIATDRLQMNDVSIKSCL
jgi:hypothetical protein